MQIYNRFKEYIDNQYGKPTGFLGSYFGEKMVRQHQPETFWTIEQLDLKKDERLLELGCGAGYAVKILLDNVAVKDIIGVDISETVLKSASIRNRSAIKNKRATFIQSDVKRLPFLDNQFTRVFSIHSIYFWDGLAESISEIHRVLKKEGTVILTLCDGKNGEVWSSIRSMVEQQVIPEMQEKGFKDVEVLKGPDSRGYHTIAVKGTK